MAASLAVLGVLNIFKFFDKDMTEFSIHSTVPKSENDVIFKGFWREFELGDLEKC